MKKKNDLFTLCLVGFIKNPLRVLALCLMVMTSTVLHGQECGVFFPFKNATYEFQEYMGAKLKPSSLYRYTVKSTGTEDGNSKSIITRVPIKKNGKPVTSWESHYTVICDKDSVKVTPDPFDLSILSRGPFRLPLILKEGTNLSKSASVYYQRKDVKDKTGRVEVYNLTIVKKETVTIPLGTFETFLIEYDWFALREAAMIPMPYKRHYKEWYSPGHGLIKYEMTPIGSVAYDVSFTKGELVKVSND